MGKLYKSITKEIVFATIVACITWACICLVIAYVDGWLPFKKQVDVVMEEISNKKEELISKETNKEILEERLNKIVEWVYKHSYRTSRKQVKEIVKTVFKISTHPLLTLAIITKESNFNPCAISPSKAIGLMQVMPTEDQMKLLREAGIVKETRDLFDIETNIKAGEFIFRKKLHKAKNNIRKALYYYVGGSKEYVTIVLGYVGELYLLYNDSMKTHSISQTAQLEVLQKK